MSIMQSFVGSNLTIGGGGPPPTGVDFFWTADQDPWIGFGTTLSAGLYSSPAPANPAYTYPDGSYTGKTRDFTGTEYLISPNLGIGGAWQNFGNSITVDIWFWPTANNIQIMSELNEQSPISGYHYSLLEIDSGGYVKAKFWQAGPQGSHQVITSTNTVDLNQWNHIYFTEDMYAAHMFQLNGVTTTGLPAYVRLTPGSTSAYFAVGLTDGTNMVTGLGFQGKLGYINIRDYVAPSTYPSTVSKFRPFI